MRFLLEEEEESHGYEQSQLDTIVLVNLIASIISLIASLCVILNYWLIPSLRKQLAYKLTLWIAISDFIFAIGNCMGAPSNVVLCHIQGIILQFGSMSSVFWVVAVSWTINHLMTVKQIKRGHLKRVLYIMHIIIWGASLITTILPLFTNTYGAAGGWCWFKDDTVIDNVWRYALFYGLLWLSIIYMIYIYIVTWLRIKRSDEESQEDNDSDVSGLTVESEEGGDNTTSAAITRRESMKEKEAKKKQKKRSKALKRMMLFPLVLIVGYLFGSIRRLVDLTAGGSPYWLAAIQVMMNSLIPFFDAVVYGMTKDVRKKDKELVQQYCGCV